MSDIKLPKNELAERKILSSCLSGNDTSTLEEMLSIISPDDFYYENNKVIFTTLKKLLDNNKPLDEISLTEHLKTSNQLDYVGGVDYIISLDGGFGTSLQARSSALIVKECSNKRSLIRSSRLAIEDIENGGDCTSAISIIEKGLDGLDQAHQEKTKLGDNAKNFLDKLSQMRDGVYVADKFPTGITHLDEKLAEGGIGRGEVMVISAPTSCGKSQLALNIALRTAITDKKAVAIFSFEMMADQIMKRLAQISSGKNIFDSLASQDVDKHMDDIITATKKLCAAPLHIINTVRDITHLRARCGFLKRKHNIEMVVVDYLQLVPWNTKLSKCDGIAEVSHGIKQMAMDLQIPVLLLAQINREGARSNKPGIYSLKDSGDVENDADIIVMMYPKNTDFAKSKKLDRNGRPYVELEYRLVKNREGERDTDGVMILDPNVGRFL
jgi:replicative DNA helicase